MNNIDLNNFEEINLSESSLSIFLVEKCVKSKKIAFFSNTHLKLNEIKHQIKQLNKQIDVKVLPDFDCDFFSNISPSKDNLLERIKTLDFLVNQKNEKIIFLISCKSLIYKTIQFKKLNQRSFLIKKNKNDEPYSQILEFINNNNYERVDFVRTKGEFSVRGNILDIFSPNHDLPLRITFDIDSIESISTFNPFNQQRHKEILEYRLIPCSEIFYENENITCFRTYFRNLSIKDKDDYYKAISNKVIIPGSGQFYPILNNKYDSILDYLNDYEVILDQNFISFFKKCYEEIVFDSDYYKLMSDLKSDFLLKLPDLKKKILNFKTLSLNYFHSKSKSRIFSKNKLFSSNKENNLKKIINHIKISNDKIINIINFENRIVERKLENILRNNSINFLKINNIDQILSNNESVYLFEFNTNNSFEIYRNKTVLNFISQKDIFNKIIKKETSNEVSSDNLINEFSQLTIGDFVVHIDHGIGKYLGLRKQNVNEIEQDFIEILYDSNDKLLIPVENLDLISKYGSDNQNVSLDKLGLQNWQFRKASIKKKIKDIALELAKTAAQRKIKKGDVIIPKNLEYEKFSSQFEFTETSDQLKAISQIELDLSSGQPMDRLVCGDVGFGKTEIAMRAAFICVSSGYQVAMICPKLLLVNQHFETFKKRFKNFDYKIEKISRFESVSKKNEIKKETSFGNINILIGTHAILAKDIEFNNLGLIIIDEEQSFGVEQKERLKKLKPNSHILTLSATPIPRTLQSSLFNLKDISLIKTPPVNRLNVKTFLTFYDNKFLKRVIDYEMKRNGQVFYVVPRIADIDQAKKKLTKILKNTEYDILHGKLKTTEIERIYQNFFSNKTKVLLSTAMIESGLDISNVNTIIIDKPNFFGLSQLYQLRGRVGRSSVQAYAYLFLEKINILNNNAIKKLDIISKIKQLGSGFSISANDLDMRGAGNIIGSEQSGHIREVGVELYYKMVNHAVEEILQNKNNLDYDNWSPSINLGFSVNIPESYISNLDHRLAVYRKISLVDRFEDLKTIFNDLNDRYGKVPSRLDNFFKIIEIKILAKQLNISKIDLGEKGCVFSLKDNDVSNFDKIINLVKTQPNRLKVTPTGKIIFFPKKGNKINKINDIIGFLNFLKN